MLKTTFFFTNFFSDCGKEDLFKLSFFKAILPLQLHKKTDAAGNIFFYDCKKQKVVAGVHEL